MEKIDFYIKESLRQNNIIPIHIASISTFGIPS